MRYRAARQRAKIASGDERQRIVRATQRERRDIATGAIERRLIAAFGPEAEREELLWFWFNHFNVYWHKEGVGVALPGYLDTLRTHLDSPFRELLRAASLHPAMLIYLDNEKSRAGRVNENHARELLELHTLGVEGGYTQRDVQELARVMTGFGVRTPDNGKAHRRTPAGLREEGDFRFEPRSHDGGTKQVLGTTLEPSGEVEFDRMLTVLATHVATAAHLSRKLAQFVVGDDPSPALLEAAAAAWRDSEGRAAAVSAAIRAHPDRPHRPSFKDPRRWVLSAARLLAGPATPRDAGPIARWMTALGQPMYGCRTPDGWSLRGADWVGAGQLTQRFDLAPEMVATLPRLLDERAEAPPERLARIEAAAAHWRPADASRRAWARASSGDERIALILSSPEFMHWVAA